MYAEMEVDDDLIVVIVDEKHQANSKVESDVVIKKEFDDNNYFNIEEIIESVEKHGELIEFDLLQVKEETPNQNYEFLEDGLEEYTEDHFDLLQVKEETPRQSYEFLEDGLEEYTEDPDYVEDECDEEDADEDDADEYIEGDEDVKINEQYSKNGRRYKMRKPWQRKSFVRELKRQCPELKNNENLLVETLAQVMKSVKRPPPPRDYFLMTGAQFECVICSMLSDTIPAAWRHYQEKHGTRYLICYACGVDFRSTTNLYKHEKRCNAPDAVVVLKARAHILGAKARNRPFVDPQIKVKKPAKYYYQKNSKGSPFKCDLCSAKFTTKTGLQAHEMHHMGLRPYRCSQCPAAYTSKSALGRHYSKHSGVEYVCDHCNRSFYAKAALVAHMDTHKPLRKYPCDRCERRFAQKAALQLHIDKIHLNLPPPCACQICPRRFPRMSLLKTHMQREHGMGIMTRKMFFKRLPMMPEEQVEQAKVILKSDLLALDRAYMLENVDIQYVPEENYGEQTETHVENNFMQYFQELRNGVIYAERGEIVELNNGEIVFGEHAGNYDEIELSEAEIVEQLDENTGRLVTIKVERIDKGRNESDDGD